MKKLLLLAAGLALLISGAQAEIIIYKVKITGSATGGGVTTRGALGGYAVLDTDDPNYKLGFVLTRRDVKTYVEYAPTPPTHWTFFSGAGGKNYSSYGQLYTGDLNENQVLETDMIYLKGTDALLDVGSGHLESWPKSFAGFGRSNLGDTFQKHEESKINLTFDKTLTQTSNANSDSFETAVLRVELFLESQGYVAQ